MTRIELNKKIYEKFSYITKLTNELIKDIEEYKKENNSGQVITLKINTKEQIEHENN